MAHVPGETPQTLARPGNPYPDDEDDVSPDGNPGTPYVRGAPQLAALRVPTCADSSFQANQHAFPLLASPAEDALLPDVNRLAPSLQQTGGQTLHTVVQDARQDKGSWATGVFRGSNARFKEKRRGELPRLNKTSATTTTPNVEQILKDLKEPLGVVYTVESSEVRGNIEDWREAIVKELKSLQDLGVIVRHNGEAARVYAATPNLTIVPGKVVWTVKPPESSAGGKLFKRKARIVACGNFETLSGEELFASGSSVETLRVALTMAAQNAWSAAGSDIRTAFLRAPIPDGRPHGLKPPAIIGVFGLVEQDEIWEVRRALHGFREAPRYWSEFRDEILRKIRFQSGGRSYVLRQGLLETNLWSIHEECDSQDESSSVRLHATLMRGVLLVYVHDLLFLLPLKLAEDLHQTIADVWECTTLQPARPASTRAEALRFLGVEIDTCPGGFLLSASCYVLIRCQRIVKQRFQRPKNG